MTKKRNIITTLLIILIISFNYKYTFAENKSRLAGENRYETSKAISSKFNQSDIAILVTGEDYPDALSATPLASKYKAPILLTNNKSLNSNAEAELKRLKVKNVFIVGGEGVVSKEVSNKITSMGIKVERISGNNRYETSVEVAKKIGTSNGVFLSTGLNYADALSVGPIAASLQMPILLVNKGDTLNVSIDNFIKGSSISKAYIIGGETIISNSVKNKFKNSIRIFGDDRYETNRKLLTTFKSSLNFNNAYIAVGTNFPDALSGGALASLSNSPIILTNNSKDRAGKIISENSIKAITILGSTGVISDILSNELQKYVYTENNNSVSESISLDKVEEDIIKLVNEERNKVSLSSLTYNSTMRYYARLKGEDMIKNDYFAHEDLKGNLMIYYIEQDRVKYSAWGENLAWNSGYDFKTSSEIAEFFMKQWMNSPGHKANILNSSFKEIGVGVVKVGNVYYGIQQFYTK